MTRDLKIRLFAILIFISAAGIFVAPPGVNAASMGDYCQSPPFVSSQIGPNILFVIDDSGSMGWQAYAKDKNGSGDVAYDTARTSPYEGLFTPEKYYINTGTTSNPIYVEDTSATPQVCSYTLPRVCMSVDTGNNCYKDKKTHGDTQKCTSNTTPYNCATGKTCTAADYHSTGAFLNYVYMSRLDLTKWAVTGGSPATCLNLNDGDDYCNPWEYVTVTGTGKVNSVCDATGCYMQVQYSGKFMDPGGYANWGTFGGTCSSASSSANSSNFSTYPCYTGTSVSSMQVKVPWSRINMSLVKEFKDLTIRPRMGVMTYGWPGSSNTAILDQVYVGDFTQNNSSASTYPFMNLITTINRAGVSTFTPTAPALWDALNYYQQTTAAYGGFQVQTSNTDSGNLWKNPLYSCPNGGGSNCISLTCVKNNVILLSDGQWNAGGNPIAGGCQIESTLPTYSIDPAVASYAMHKGFMNFSTSATVDGVYAIGMFMTGSCSTTTSKSCKVASDCPSGEWCVGAPLALQNIAMYGSFDYNATTQPFPGNKTRLPSTADTCTMPTTPQGCGSSTLKGSLCAPLPPSSADWDKNGDNLPDTYASADDAVQIKSKIMDAVYAILKRVTSGTAASVLASGEGSGANIAQAIYYPKRRFYDNSVDWTGGLQNFWYYVDPQFVNSNIREEGGVIKDYVLDILANSATDNAHMDYVLKFRYDTNSKTAVADRFYGTADGGAGTQIDTVDFESLGNLWEAGKLLWSRDPATRSIYTPLDATQGLTGSANAFSTANLSALEPLLNTDVATATSTENTTLATNILTWVRGTDVPDTTYTTGVGTTATEMYRDRLVSIDGTTDAGGNLIQHEWKLGDIIDSTPRISSWVQLHYYDKTYNDYTYGNFVADSEYDATVPMTDSRRYRSRGTIFVGANDGMLHAFRLGRLGLKWTSQTPTQKATLKYCSTDPTIACGADSDCGGTPGSCTIDTTMGKELWAFIPKSVLPYLKYLKENDYCHLYSVDLTPYVLDASIGKPTGCAGTSDYWTCNKDASTWRTILIGGMRYGGACRNNGVACNGGTSDCVNTPVADLGYSSYFALDVTDPYNPKFMWEFNNPQLGFTTSGPSIVRINNRTVSGTTSFPDAAVATNGRWFVVLGSGPTGPIDTTEHQFMGRSDQDLNVFILDLATGALVRQIDTGIQYAFAGSMLNATHDSDLDYQDDAIYLGYTKKSSGGTWTDGGVLRILTREDRSGKNVSGSGACASDSTALNPNCWVFGRLLDGIGPVTSSVVRLQEPGGNLWVYAGTGRYFFKSSTAVDDPTSQRHLIGAKDPCFVTGSFTAGCMAATDPTVAFEPSGTVLGLTDLDTVNLATTAGVAATKGWKILLDPQDTTAKADAERVLTDPLASVSGLVYFTSFKPYNDACTTGGKTALWAVKYNTAEAGGALLKGKALIQVSTGSIEQVDLQTAFTQKSGRKTLSMEGVPPTAQGLSLISAPPPVKRVLHMRER